MSWIIIECHGGLECAAIVTNEDGTNKVFDDIIEAINEKNNCQLGILVEL